ncbi:MAG: peptidoglycan-binding protein, partial [Candidatus Ventricola sp.]
MKGLRRVTALLAVLLVLLAPAALAQEAYRTTLRQGSRGDDVTRLQNDLKALGFYHGSITGHFGGLTRDAVRRFQRKHKLTADGVAGPLTLSCLTAELGGTTPASSPAPAQSDAITLRLGAKGDAVRTLQERLDALGYYDGSITGSFGRLTQDAVFRFQRENNLSADGIAGRLTLAKLSAAIDKKDGGQSGALEGQDDEPEEDLDDWKLDTGKTLRYGTRTDEVKKLQSMLKALEFYDSGSTGYYGTQTVAAVRAFQRAQKLTEDGIAG